MAETTTITNVKRSLMRHFLNIGTAAAPQWALIGNGVSELTIAYNPSSEDHAYIHEDTPTTDLDSYKPSFPVSMVAKKGEPVFDYVDGKRIARAVGENAKTEILTVYLYKDASTGAYPAEKSSCTVQIDNFGGEGAKNATINYTISMNGDPVHGTFNPSTKEFIEAGE